MSGGGKRDGNPGIKGAGSLREAGEARAGSETSAFTGTARNRKKFERNSIYCNTKGTKRRASQRKGRRVGGNIRDYRKGDAQTPYPPRPPQ